MRRMVLALVCLVGAWLAPAMAQEWYRLTSAEGAFTASVPAQPTYEAVPIRNSEYTLHQWVYDTAEIAYLVSYIDYHQGHVANGGGVQAMLDALTRGLHTNRTPISERHITHRGYATRDVVVRDNPSGFIVRQRHMMVGDRAYVWNYTGTAGTENRPDVQRFLNSLVVQR
jgi:hypothetical protein